MAGNSSITLLSAVEYAQDALCLYIELGSHLLANIQIAMYSKRFTTITVMQYGVGVQHKL